MIGIAVRLCLCLVAILWAAALPALAQTISVDSAIKTLEMRLAETRPADDGRQAIRDQLLANRIRGAFQDYVNNKAFPTITDKGKNAGLKTTLEANLVQRISVLDPDDLEALRNLVDSSTGLRARGTEMIRAVMFYSVADADILEADERSVERHAWRRMSADNPAGRRAPDTFAAENWRDTENQFREYLRQARTYYGSEAVRFAIQDASGVLQMSRPDPANGERKILPVEETLANMPRDRQVAILEDRLQETLHAQGLNPTATFLRNMAEMHYMMVGWTRDKSGRAVLAGLQALERLEADLAAREADGRPATLEAALSEVEHAFGFRSEHPVPTGFLPPEVFAATVRGNYTMTDDGAGLHHGALTHRLQLRAILEDYQVNQDRYAESIAETYSQMGAFDVTHSSILRGVSGRFDFEPERLSQLWFQLFDHFLEHNNRLRDLSHPDGVLILTRFHGSLTRIQRELEQRFTDRRQEGSPLRADWNQAYAASGEKKPLTTLRTELSFMNNGGPDADAAFDEVLKDDARIKRNLSKRDPRYPQARAEDDFNDKLWQIVRMRKLAAQPNHQRAQFQQAGEAAAGPIDLLMPGGVAFDSQPDAAAMGAQRTLHTNKKLPNLPTAAAAAAAPSLPAGVDDAVSTSDIHDAAVADTSSAVDRVSDEEAARDADASPPLPPGIDTDAAGAGSADHDAVDADADLAAGGDNFDVSEFDPFENLVSDFPSDSDDDDVLSVADYGEFPPEFSNRLPGAAAETAEDDTDRDDDTEAERAEAPALPDDVDRSVDERADEHEVTLTVEEESRRDAERLARLEEESNRRAAEDRERHAREGSSGGRAERGAALAE